LKNKETRNQIVCWRQRYPLFQRPYRERRSS